MRFRHLRIANSSDGSSRRPGNGQVCPCRRFGRTPVTRISVKNWLTLFAAAPEAYAGGHSMGERGSSARGYRDSSDPVRWARAHDLFQAALDLPPDQRQAFVDSRCGDDAGLRDEVSSLLASDQEAGQFIEQPAAVLLANLAPGIFRPRLAPGDSLGRYEILEFLGAGGIGEVYRARDTRLGRNVAVKLVTDPNDPEAGPRLLAEARHASILNHPNICGVYEVDEAGGLPFMVLELSKVPHFTP